MVLADLFFHNACVQQLSRKIYSQMCFDLYTDGCLSLFFVPNKCCDLHWGQTNEESNTNKPLLNGLISPFKKFPVQEWLPQKVKGLSVSLCIAGNIGRRSGHLHFPGRLPLFIFLFITLRSVHSLGNKEDKATKKRRNTDRNGSWIRPLAQCMVEEHLYGNERRNSVTSETN